MLQIFRSSSKSTSKLDKIHFIRCESDFHLQKIETLKYPTLHASRITLCLFNAWFQSSTFSFCCDYEIVCQNDYAHMVMTKSGKACMSTM